jgi:glycerophosphoryl diester phosphodiesterase
MAPPVFAGFARPLLFAHRGASALAPENTIEAFDLATRFGADVLEMDVHMTQDGEVVVLHDDTLERTTDGAGPVAGMAYNDLRRLDAGYRFTTPNGAKPFLGRGCTVPRLEEVLRTFAHMGFNIEIKQANPTMVPAVLRLLERFAPRGVVLAAADPVVMQQIEAASPGCALGLSTAQVKQVMWAATTGWSVPVALHGRALQIPPRWRGIPVATRRVVACARRCAMPVHVWTINQPIAATRLLAYDIDGIMSDDPARLASEVDAFRNRRSTP